MNSVKTILTTSIHFLNQPVIKEGVKKVVSSVTFAFGLMELYDIYEIMHGRSISTESSCPNSPKWLDVAYKVTVVFTKISLILSAGVSQPGVFAISSLAGCFFSTTQLEHVFGPNTIFAINPRHPRHVSSIAAVVLALPSAFEAICEGSCWAYRKIRHYQDTPSDRPDVKVWLTDTKMRLMALFNVVTSRPALHLGNQLGRFILRAV